MTGTVLDRIVADTRRRLADHPPDRGALEQRVAVAPPVPGAVASLRQPGVRVIAEIKRRSPSEGALRPQLDPTLIAQAYAQAGAAAISVLTEPDHFGGSLGDLSAIAQTVALPCLRKDFVVDEIQLLEARAAGASMVLLIASVLDEALLRGLHARARELGLVPLVETHDEQEIARAVDVGAELIGVNCRDLRTFEVDLGVAERLRGHIPGGVVAVAESGIKGPDDLGRLRRAGYDVFLVGSGLVTASDPGHALRALVDTGA